MAIELHDANLQKARGELTQLIQALAALQISQVGGDAVGLDPVTGARGQDALSSGLEVV